jgi:hypothetical protein
VGIVPLERKFLDLSNGNNFQNMKILVLDCDPPAEGIKMKTLRGKIVQGGL